MLQYYNIINTSYYLLFVYPKYHLICSRYTSIKIQIVVIHLASIRQLIRKYLEATQHNDSNP